MIIKRKTRARKTGMGVRYVLAISLILAVVAMIIVYLGFI